MSSPVRPGQRLTENVLSYAVMLGGLATIAVAARMMITSCSPLFFWDGWEMVFAAARGENLLSWHWLWAQHNEHRLLIPKLLEIADLRWFHGRQVFLLACIFGIQCAHLAVLGWSMRALGNLRGAAWRTGFGAAAFCLFCVSQWENLVWGFQTCFLLPLLFATLSFVGLLLCWRRQTQREGAPTWPFLAMSVIAALGANWSLANGVLLWPLLLVASLALRLRRSVPVIYAVVGAVSAWLYFHSFVPGSEGGGPLAALHSPFSLLQYTATYLGSVWVTSNLHIAMVLGSLGLVAAVIVLSRSRRYIRYCQPFSIQMVLTVLFCLGTILLTAMGRMHFGLGQAFASRYQTVALLFWWSLGMLVVGPLFERSRSSYPSTLTQIFVLAVFLRGALLMRQPTHEVRVRQFAIDTASAALLANVNDFEVLGHVYPVPDAVWNVAQSLRTQQLSVFTGAVEMGAPLGSRFTIVPETNCIGEVESNATVGGTQTDAAKVAGWAWDTRDRRPPVAIVAASGGAISGWGAVGSWRPTVRASHRGISNSYIGFTGYVHNGTTPAQLYAILPGNPASACPIAEIDRR